MRRPYFADFASTQLNRHILLHAFFICSRFVYLWLRLDTKHLFTQVKKHAREKKKTMELFIKWFIDGGRVI